MTAPAIVANRLYGISLRPQEMALYGERVTFDLRYAPVFEDPAEETTAHYKLLVLEVSADLPADDALGRQGGPLQLLKCGWELELTTESPQRVGTLPEQPEEIRLLLDRVAETVNELARRAGLEAPLGPDVISQLVRDYRLQASGSGV